MANILANSLCSLEIELFWRKDLSSKISWNCPFKGANIVKDVCNCIRLQMNSSRSTVFSIGLRLFCLQLCTYIYIFIFILIYKNCFTVLLCWRIGSELSWRGSLLYGDTKERRGAILVFCFSRKYCLQFLNYYNAKSTLSEKQDCGSTSGWIKNKHR